MKCWHTSVFYKTRGTLNISPAHLTTHILSFPSLTCTRSEEGKGEKEKYINLSSTKVDNSITINPLSRYSITGGASALPMLSEQVSTRFFGQSSRVVRPFTEAQVVPEQNCMSLHLALLTGMNQNGAPQCACHRGPQHTKAGCSLTAGICD